MVVPVELETCPGEFEVDFGDVCAEAWFVSDGGGIDAVVVVDLTAEALGDEAGPALGEGPFEVIQGSDESDDPVPVSDSAGVHGS